MMEIIGWTGSLLFALCAIPQAIQSWRQKHSNGLTWSFLLMWFFGEVLMIIYVSHAPETVKDDVAPLLANYYLNIALLIIIIWYRLFPQRQ